MKKKLRLLALGISGMTAMGMTLAGVPASAAPKAVTTGGCQDKHICLYYNSDLKGAMFQHRYNISNYAGYVFTASDAGSAGAGQPVKNNVASADNADAGNGIRIYVNSNYVGDWDGVPPWTWRNLDVAKNNNASGKWDH
ncbi:peptidase inhibitor family I36 protein [Streptomyces sp. AC536]|uniref:peptidase inhibitor family I36 protein n=1 Tax=Streptomyces buecherae TaxID=2763006 RepID=UPI00164D3D4F|nr:peptidase inhibitor family I36 protein [Streptomyces buecherae]MBC3985634.1 peptidase inhibitor family I36 protein [Streptomyces buecherae]QNJ42399.1 peptidase inhibitor family I36 protein [Streptomyces buecherae]